MSDVDDRERIDRLYERAVETVETLMSASETEDRETILSLLDEIEDIVDEVEDVLSTVDLTDLVAAVDWSELPEAVEVDDLPEAVEEGDASEAVSLRKLVDVVDLREVWESTNERALWRQKRELSDEVDDLTDDRDGGDTDGDAAGVSISRTGEEGHDIDPTSVENAIQTEVSDSVGEFRDKLIAAHERFQEVRERNEDRFPDRRRNRSRNPAAVSTVPADGPAARSGTTHSTVPEETRHSTAPNRKRIYGPRFDRVEEVTDE